MMFIAFSEWDVAEIGSFSIVWADVPCVSLLGFNCYKFSKYQTNPDLNMSKQLGNLHFMHLCSHLLTQLIQSQLLFFWLFQVKLLIFPSCFVKCCSFLRDGNLPDIVNSGSLHEFLVNLHERYGPVVSFWFGRRLVVSLGTVEVLKQHINPNKTCKFNLIGWSLSLKNKHL